MLSLAKNKSKHEKFSGHKGLFSLFGIMVLVGFGAPYLTTGVGTTASAVGDSSSVVDSEASIGSTLYTYTQISVREAYPYYIAASFMVAGGLSLYALSYAPNKAERRSRYISRQATWARTTY